MSFVFLPLLWNRLGEGTLTRSMPGSSLHRPTVYATVRPSASSKRPLCRVACSIQEPRIAFVGSSHVRRCCIQKGKYAGSPRRFGETDTARPLRTGHSFITFINYLQYKECIMKHVRLGTITLSLGILLSACGGGGGGGGACKHGSSLYAPC